MGSARKILSGSGSSARQQPTAATNGNGKVETKRITVDLPRDEHRFLRDATYDMDTDGIKVVRALLQELREDEELFSRVRERVAGL